MKLYCDNSNPKRWFAFSPDTGWVMFPADLGGWEKRLPARGIDPLRVRQVPLDLAFNTGIPGAPFEMVEAA